MRRLSRTGTTSGRQVPLPIAPQRSQRTRRGAHSGTLRAQAGAKLLCVVAAEIRFESVRVVARRGAGGARQRVATPETWVLHHGPVWVIAPARREGLPRSNGRHACRHVLRHGRLAPPRPPPLLVPGVEFSWFFQTGTAGAKRRVGAPSTVHVRMTRRRIGGMREVPTALQSPLDQM